MLNYEDPKVIEVLAEHYSRMPGLHAWKRLNGEYMLVSDEFAQHAGFRDAKDFMSHNLTDADLRCSASDLAQQFVEEDRKVFKNKRPYIALERLCYANDNWRTLVGHKFPIFNQQGEVIVVGFSLHDITEANLSILSYDFLEANMQKNIGSQKQFTTLIDPEALYHELTGRQKEVIYHLLRGGTAKTIAKELSLSPSTVSDHIEKLKLKFKCCSKYELIGVLICKGLLGHDG